MDNRDDFVSEIVFCGPGWFQTSLTLPPEGCHYRFMPPCMAKNDGSFDDLKDVIKKCGLQKTLFLG